jgi:hypothetical protein
MRKTGKRILEVKIIRAADTNPDTSYLGEYSQREKSRFSIDRAHAQDCASLEANSGPAVLQLGRILKYIESLYNLEFEASNARYHATGDENTDEIDALTEACDEVTGLQSDVQDCDCDGDHCPRGEYQYFNPSSNYVTKEDKPQAGLTEADVVKYTRQDYERMESLNAGHWGYTGIRAQAEVTVPMKEGLPSYATAVLTQTLTSGGLWGIESDSDSSYFADVQAEELAELKQQLRAFGFSARAIATAFKNVKEVDA